MESYEVDASNPVVSETLAAECQAQKASDYLADFLNEPEYSNISGRYLDPVYDAHEWDGEGRTVGLTRRVVWMTIEGGAPMEAFCNGIAR